MNNKTWISQIRTDTGNLDAAPYALKQLARAFYATGNEYMGKRLMELANAIIDNASEINAFATKDETL